MTTIITFRQFSHEIGNLTLLVQSGFLKQHIILSQFLLIVAAIFGSIFIIYFFYYFSQLNSKPKTLFFFFFITKRNAVWFYSH